MKRSDINHLRRLLGWVRCDIGQAPADMQRTMIDIADKLGAVEIDDAAKGRLVDGYRRAEAVPQYVRDAVKALEKAVLAVGREGGHLDDQNRPESRANTGEGGGLLDAYRYRILRDDPRSDVRILGVGKRSGDQLDAAVDVMGAGPESGAKAPRAIGGTCAIAGSDRGAGAGPALPADWSDDIEIERGLAEIGVYVWGPRAEDWLAGVHYAARLLGYRLPEATANAPACRRTPAPAPTLCLGAGAPHNCRSPEKLQAMQEDVALDPLAGCSTVAAQPQPDATTIYLGCARMGLAGASDEEVLRYASAAIQTGAPTRPERDEVRARVAAFQEAYDALQSLFIEALKARVPGEPEDLEDNDQKFNIGQCGMAAGLTRGQQAIRALMQKSATGSSESEVAR